LLGDGGAPGADIAPLHAYIAALVAALDGAPGAAVALLAAAGPLLTDGTAAEQADAMAGIANVAKQLDDPATELVARRQAISAQRAAGEERESLVSLSVMLYNLAMLHIRQDNHAAAVPLLEEVVALDQRTGHPDLESDRAALEQARRAAGLANVTLRDAIVAWRDGGRAEDSFATLLNDICNYVVAALREGTAHDRGELAQDLAQVRAVRPLPIAGASDFLHVLQLWLRGEPEMIERAERIRAALPAALAQALSAIERMIVGEDQQDAEDETIATEPNEAEVAAMLAALTPEQRAELAVLQQVAPAFERAGAALSDPRAGVADRSELARQVEQMAARAAEGEAQGSPWLDAAAGLRALAALLRGHSPDLDALAPSYRALIEQMLG
jgi:hypothetical protein